MAFDILSILGISSKYKRVFSSAKILLNDKKTRIKEDIIETSKYLRI